jgi:hypothetical protein
LPEKKAVRENNFFKVIGGKVLTSILVPNLFVEVAVIVYEKPMRNET